MRRQLQTSVLSLALGALSLALLLGNANAQGWKSDDGKTTAVTGTEAKLMQDPAAGMRHTMARLDTVSWTGWSELSELLEDIHARTGIPALAVAFVRDGEVVAQATVGVQQFGSSERVDAQAPVHLGSVTKSFTATLVGKLVEEGLLEWEATIGEVLEGVPMQDAYRGVTLEQLLQHRSGLPALTDQPVAGLSDFTAPAGTLQERRTAFLEQALQTAPVGEPGGAMLYSNLGYAVAGLMAERVTGASWEQLTRDLIFEPLGLRSGGFGIPLQPSGHAGNGPEFYPVPEDAYPPTERIAPAGNIHCSVADLGHYALAHLAGLGGRDGLLKSATVRRLHTAPPLTPGASAAGGRAYAGGWRIGVEPGGEPVHWHGGTVGASYAEVRLHPASNSAVVFLTTVGPGLGETLAAQVSEALRVRYGAQTGGFITAAADGGDRQLQITEEEVQPGDDERFWHVIEGLSNALNDEDREAFAALFDPSYSAASRDSLFEFMAGGVLPRRGGLRAFHDPSAPFRMGPDEALMRMVVFHLENGFPGYFGITLSERGQVTEFSLFVKADLCPNGTDRHCALSTRLLEEGGR